MDEPTLLTGGNSNQVQRVGATVLRNTGTWSPFVHALLRYLNAQQFTYAPTLISTTATQETLSFIEGEVGNDPLKPDMQTDSVLVEAAHVLRQFHDLTQQFTPDSTIALPPAQSNAEVICHNDFAPYNCVFRDGHLVGVIDFDTAAPGSRLWDVAYTVYRFVPLMRDEHCALLGWQPIPDRARRLKLFVDAYGLADATALIDTVIARVEAMQAYIRSTGRNLEHLPLYEADAAYLRDNYTLFKQALVS